MTIKPMLAIPLADAHIEAWEDWALEEKFDGHRLVVHITHNSVQAWTRPRKHAGAEGKTMALRALPLHLERALLKLHEGIYDGELLAGDVSTDVTRVDLLETQRFVVFDMLALGTQQTTSLTYDERRELLERVFRTAFRNAGDLGPVQLAESYPLRVKGDVAKHVERIWKRGGEGAILKRRASVYLAGKRSPDCVKVKKRLTAVLPVVGFKATKGKVMNRGIFASVLLRDDNGLETSCKTLDDDELNAFRKAWDAFCERYAKKQGVDPRTLSEREQLKLANTHHPALGRKLRIDFQDYTRDGGYRGPIMWDRWEDE